MNRSSKGRFGPDEPFRFGAGLQLKGGSPENAGEFKQRREFPEIQ